MDKKRIVREGYNQVAEKYLERRNEDLEEMKFLPEFSSLIKQDGKVLDAGCGGGLPFTKYLSDRFDVVGIDISEKQIELAKNNVPNAQFFVKDMTQLDFPENFFDGILAYYSIIHVPREEQHNLFVNFYRMLKPNGVALFSLHSTDDPGSFFDDFFDATMFWSGFDAETNLKILTEIGFEIIWSKLVDDSLGDAKHLFVLIRKWV
ncbi:MAG: class I SAM-dependent methyltransferase [Candidatus Heimdallarchaeota archaeon]|nr:class I SAM-dependent methyltransferase [Candidatus Heimdallarchaeota archaeon]MBY8994816.1 class I SAM-dependent methyltransferase [Candidatus Heimdallarchaeota archaeon]